MPIAIAANAVPIIAFAPIFNAWFDPLSPHSKMAIAAVLCFFPVMVNTLRGLQSASRAQIELMRSYAAGELEIWRRVRVPTALPYVFTALKVASVLAMIGAIVGEYFGGSFNALGVLIRSDAQIFDFQRGVGRHPRRLAARDRALRGGRRSPSGSSSAGRRRRERLVIRARQVRIGRRTAQDNERRRRMKKRWIIGVRARARGRGRGGQRSGRRRAASAQPKLTKVTLQLKWVPQAQFAGYYAASLKGFYKAQGLDVTLKNGGPDIVPEQVVASGQAQFGVDWLPSLLAARDKGTDLVNIAQVFARSGMTAAHVEELGHQHRSRR